MRYGRSRESDAECREGERLECLAAPSCRHKSWELMQTAKWAARIGAGFYTFRSTRQLSSWTAPINKNFPPPETSEGH